MPGCRVEDAGAAARDGVPRHVRQVGQPVEEAARRDVLAERDPVDLVVAGDHLAVRAPGHRRVPEPVGAHVLDHAGDDRGLQRLGQRRQGLFLDRAVRARRRRRPRPPATTPGRGRSSAPARPAPGRSNTRPGSLSTARSPRSPPPCTAAVRIRPDSSPAGATAPAAASTAARPSPARPPTIGATRAPRGARIARTTRVASPAPARPTTPTINSRPPRRAAGASGPPAWPRSMPASGSPPNGKAPRTASAATNADGKATIRTNPDAGTKARKTVRIRASRVTTATRPGTLNSRIHHSAGR